LARGGERISYNQLTNDGYNRPIEAAASTGKTLIVQRLLNIVDPRFSSMTVLGRHNSFVSLQEAARLAGKVRDAESAYLLLKFIKVKAPEQLEKEMFDRTKSFLVRAANNGCLRFVKLVNDAEGPATRPDPYRNALLPACRAGYTEIVQYFLEYHIAATDRLDICKEGMPEAIQHGHRVMVELFRAYGVDLQPNHLVDCFGKPKHPLDRFESSCSRRGSFQEMRGVGVQRTEPRVVHPSLCLRPPIHCSNYPPSAGDWRKSLYVASTSA
jgi:hypothetical protein